MRIDRKQFKDVYIAAEIAQADAVVSVAHFKGHELSGFGGTLKNIGMGCATREGKLAQHCDVSPVIYQEKCVGCGKCQEICPVKAILIKDAKAHLDRSLCIGCASCIG